MQVSIRNVDERVFKKFRADAINEGINVGKAITLAMQNWIEKKQKRNSLLELKPFSWGKGTERLSEEIDKELYA